MDVANDDGNQDAGLAKSRSRREKVDRHGRKAALDKFRQSRSGLRPKFAMEEERDIYEEVDEAEYSRIVRDRQDDDWIVDDGTGYVEDGREIFDEDPDVVSSNSNTKKNKGPAASRSKPAKDPNIRPTDSKPVGIRGMFAAAAVKPKVQKTVSLDDDDILGDIMGELKRGDSDSFRPAPVKLPKQTPTMQSKMFNASRTEFTSLSNMSAFRPAERSKMQNTEHEHSNVTPRLNAKPKPFDSVAVEPPTAHKKTDSGCSRQLTSNGEVASSLAQKRRRVEADSSVQILQFESQNPEQQESEIIDEFENEMEDTTLCSDMDVSGIDFNDNFDAEVVEKPKKTIHNDTATVNGYSKSSSKDLPLENTSTLWQCDAEPAVDVSIDASKLPLTSVNGEDVLRFFWLDAFEDYLKQPGVVYLFGKVYAESASAHVSCCVTVRNIERRVLLLPRRFRYDLKNNVEDTSRPVTFVDVYQEFNDVIAEQYKIMTFKSMKVSRSYAFEIADVPAESEYLEVRYSPDLPALPSTLKGETFSCVFGTNTSALEMFLLDRKIKGPSWLDISGAQVSPQSISWCRLEAFITKPDLVKVSDARLPPPPLVVMALVVRSVPHPRTHQNELIAVASLVHNAFALDRAAPKPPFQSHFCIVAPPTNCVFPFDFRDQVAAMNKAGSKGAMKIETISSERGLIGFFLAKLHKVDPDVIIGHDVAGYDFDVLLHRISATKAPHWSKLGRLKRATMPKFGARSNPAAGRLVLDTMISAKELIRCRSYDLTEVASHVLKEHRRVYEPDDIRNAYNSSQGLLGFLESTLIDATFSLRIACDLNALPLASQITNICGNVMSRTLAGGRSERNEYLLLHAFAEKNFIVPDKVYGKRPAPVHQMEDRDEEEDADATKKSATSKRKPAYTGGLVLEPKRGFYDKYILLVDFNSLYPSIIQEYNICFTTVPTCTKKGKSSNDDDEDYDESFIPESGLEPGILPTEIRKLVESRKQVRQLMKATGVTTDQLAQYDIRQRALKLTANSLYGCLGFTHSRFYARRLAALVTGKGREILMKTRDLVQSMNLDVIYGDTDSLMIATGSLDIDEVYRLGNKIKAEVNKLYRHLEIDIDGVFRSMLLLKKKKYAALSVQKVGDKMVTTQEMKGLDMVRRDWCILAKEAGTYVVSQILSGESREAVVEAIHTRLMEIRNGVRSGETPLEAFQITKQLTKNPEEYPDRKNLPHVQVAMRLNSSAGNGGRHLRAGDAVVYVVCDDGSNLPATQRAYHPDLEVAKRPDLKIDAKYYLEQQVHPVVTRLCDPIEGTDAARIAECLGLDSTGFRQAMRRNEDEDEVLLAAPEESDLEKYRDCERFSFPCLGCGASYVVDGVLKSGVEPKTLVLEKCSNCQMCPLDKLPYIQNRLTVAMRQQVHRYYEGWQVCEDAACAARTRRTPLVLIRGQPVCPTCHHGIIHPEVSERAVYNQLGFYRHVFDFEKAVPPADRNAFDHSMKECINKLKIDADRVIRKSAYSEVNLSRLFAGLFPGGSR